MRLSQIKSYGQNGQFSQARASALREKSSSSTQTSAVPDQATTQERFGVYDSQTDAQLLLSPFYKQLSFKANQRRDQLSMVAAAADGFSPPTERLQYGVDAFVRLS